jgi:hypothetical protein
MAKKYRKRDLWQQKVWHQAPYTVVTYFMRRDNQGNPRMFRMEYGVSTYAQAKACYEDRVSSGKNVRVVWYGLNQRVVAEAGDPATESYWQDANENKRTAVHS